MAEGARRQPRRTLGLWALSVLCSAALLWIAHRRFAVELWPSSVRVVAPELLWVALALHPVYALVRAARLQFVLDPIVRDATQDSRACFDRPALYGSGLVSALMLLLMPFKLGEASRPLLLVRPKVPGIGLSSAVGAVGVERIVDGLMICTMLFVGLAMTARSTAPGGHASAVASFGQVMGGAFVFALVIALVMAQAPARWGGAVGRLAAPGGSRLVAWISRAVERLAIAFACLLQWRNVVPLLVWSMVYWAITVAQLWLIARATGLALDGYGAMATVAMIGLSIQLPGGPAQTGTFQVGAGAALTLLVDLSGSYVPAQSFVALAFAVGLAGALAMAVPGIALMALSHRRSHTSDVGHGAAPGA